MSDKLRKALENAISVIESVRESGAVDADDLLWLDRECAAAANAGYIALAARHDSLGRELSANYDDDPAHYLPGDYIARRECGGACHDHTLAAVIDTLTRLRDGS